MSEREARRLLDLVMTGPELMAMEFPIPQTARQALEMGECTPACLLALGDGECTCPCRGDWHGAVTDAALRPAVLPRDLVYRSEFIPATGEVLGPIIARPERMP